MSYVAPVKDMKFVIKELAGLNAINQLPGCEDATEETVDAILEENAKFCGEVLAPLNFAGDKEPSYWHDGQVTTTKGFKEAFKAFGEAGWQGVQHPVDFGGQGLPKLVATPCIEMLNSSNLSFASLQKNLTQLGHQLRHQREQIADDAVVGHRKNWRFRILVDGDDGLRIFHAGKMLNRTGNTDRDVQVRRDDLAGLAHLPVVRHKAGIDGGT